MRRTFTVPPDVASLGPDEERRRLLRDVHDSIGPTLAAAALGVHAARNLLASDRAAADQVLLRIEEELHSAIAEIRRLAHDVHPPILDRLGFVAAVRRYAETLGSRMSSAARPLRIEVEVCGELPELPVAVEVAAYRILREALTNVSRHADAWSCTVRIRFDGELQLEVIDNGNGAVSGGGPDDLAGGAGLGSMRERASALGGRLAVGPATPGGTRVAATLPVGRG
ncbi:MAG TPA: sensor histidine kinase [Pseudonocardiaceae bacterium]